MAIPASIQNLIQAHKNDNDRLERAGSLPQINVSKAVSAMAKLYEVMRNTVDYEEEHLLRKRAIKRILLRLGVLRRNITDEVAGDLMKEIIWANYMSDYPVPEASIEAVKRALLKYKYLVDTYINIYDTKPGSDVADFLYALLAFEIERILVPHAAFDALVNAQYQHIMPMKLLANTEIPEKELPVQTYITVHRALVKSDNEIISYYLFHNAFTNWAKPETQYFTFVAKHLDKVVSDIKNHLSGDVPNKIFREVVRQGIPFKILNNIIKSNPDEATGVLQDKKELDSRIDVFSKTEYRKIQSKLRNTIVKSVIYLFVTKVGFALLIEVPYELFVYHHINFFTLGINVIFPPILMFIIANTVKIPETRNTLKLKEMIHSIMDPQPVDLSKVGFNKSAQRSGFMAVMFRTLNFISFIAVFGLIIFGLYLLNFSIVGMGIFLMFVTLISFVAFRLKNTAMEIIVVNQARSIFSPLIDMASVPILRIGKNLSESVSQVNVFVLFFDFLLEAPFKTIIKVIEEWASYLRDSRDEIV